MSENIIIIKNKIYDITNYKKVRNDIDLELTRIEDEIEIDELALIQAHKKTKNGYLKDNFILEDSEYVCVKCNSIFTKKRKTKNDICKKCK